MKGSAGSTLGIENGICIEIKNRVWEERRPFMAYIEFNNVTKEYKTGETSIKALDGASFSVEKGELAVILGSSGAQYFRRNGCADCGRDQGGWQRYCKV